MHEDVESPEVLLDSFEDRLELARLRDVQRQEQRRRELSRERLDVGLRLLVQIGDRHVRTELVERSCTAVGDRVLVRDAHHQRLVAEQRPAIDLFGHESASFYEPGVYLLTAIDFRNSTRLYAKKPTPTPVTMRNSCHTALKPPPRYTIICEKLTKCRAGRK
jgi:hypothetical protein